MRRIGNLKEEFLDFTNLYFAYGKAFRGTKSPEAYAFAFQAEGEIFRLQKELREEVYHPAPYRYFTIYEPKERVISVAPFRDRVVHHALVNVLEPIYEARFIFHSYATRKNKGTHRAIEKAQKYLRNNHWYLKMDIRKYFDSIIHGKLIEGIARTIKDPFLLRLCSCVTNRGGDGQKGLPIGNLTSQFFANVYLNPFDHFIKEELKIRAYIRYMDDMVFFSQDKEQLLAWQAEIINYLKDRLSLSVKQEVILLNHRLHGLPFLGVRIFPSLIRWQQKNFKRSYKKFLQRQWEYEHKFITYEQYQSSMMSLISWLTMWGDHLLIKKSSGHRGVVSKAGPTG